MPARRQHLFDLRDPGVGLGLLTRLPVKVNTDFAMARGAAAAWAWPLVGVVVGGLGAVAGLAALSLGLGAPVAAGLALATQVLVTGALHEDGLADCADGFWGGWTRARRLEIMADSRIGAYGVLALVFAIGLMWQALAALMADGSTWVGWLVVAGMLSRAAMAWTMATLPAARPGGLSARVGRPTRVTAGAAALGAVGLSSFLLDGAGILAALVVAAVTLGLGKLARNRIGGQTGDVLGGVQVVTALATLLVGVALVS